MTPVHPLLRFESPVLEAAFRADYARRSRGLVQASLLLGVLQYAGYGLLDDYMVPVGLGEVRAIRAVVCLFVGVALVYSVVRPLDQTMQPILALAGSVSGLGIAAMVWVARAGTAYYAYFEGVVLLLFYLHVLLRLRFVLASTTAAGLIVVYLATLAYVDTPAAVWVNSAYYLIAANLCGMVASYALERYARREFVHGRALAQSNDGLEATLRDLRAAQDRLVHQEKQASLGRLAAGIAHELRNPLNFVTNFAELAAEQFAELRAALGTALNPEAAAVLADLEQNVAKIDAHGRRADGIVTSMLDHARAQAGTPRPVDLNALMQTYASLAADGFHARHADIAVDVRCDLDPAVGEAAAVPQELGRVLLNLLGNAFDAVRERWHRAERAYAPVVTVATRRHARAVELRVSDNGPGMAAEVRERAFEPFFTTKPPGQGTGLGLSLAYDIVTAGHGGHLAVETVEGEGATFIVTLPVEPLPV